MALLGLLVWLKYLPFLVRTANSLLARLPMGWQIASPTLVQPVGLSFFTLMAISYLVDVRRGTTRPAVHYWQVLLYLSFWPHVVEGPFDRWGQISPALLDPPKPDYRALHLRRTAHPLGHDEKTDPGRPCQHVRESRF